MEIKGKAAVVTGSCRGVGRATALALAERGCSVAINYLGDRGATREMAEDVAHRAEQQGVKAVCVQCDVSDDSQCRTMVSSAADAFGRLDVLVNNAGATRLIKHSDLEAVSDEDWDLALGVNLRGAFYCARAARSHLAATGNGEIVNVSSVGGVAGVGSSIPYCASKAGLSNLTVTLARALGPEIRVNAVAPGFIEGEWMNECWGDRFERVKTATAARSVTGRVNRPEDVAAAIVAIITGPDQITGQIVTVDGGYLLGPKLS